MNETRLKIKVKAMLRKEFPEAYFFKVSDRFTSGISDILGVLSPHGKFIAIELKVKPNKPTKLQKHFIDTVNEHGGKACVCYSVEDVKNFMRKEVIKNDKNS